MIETTSSILNISAAIASVQKAVASVKRDSTNPHFRNRYASLETVVDAIREHYLAANMAVVQAPGEVVNGMLSVSTMGIHTPTGEWIRTTMQIPLGKMDPQGAGSALTYAERYSLMAYFNLPPTDDDAEAAVAPAKEAPLPREEFVLPTKLAVDMTLPIPSFPLDWGKLLSMLTEFANANEWPYLKALWKNNTPFFESLKAYSELDYQRLYDLFMSKKT